MSTGRFSRIIGLGHGVCGRRVSNAEIEAQHGLASGWIERRTGIRYRFRAEEGDTLLGLAAAAGGMAIAGAGIRKSQIGLTVLATSTPDHLLPATSAKLVHELSLEHSGAVDLAGACSGFLYAYALADCFTRTHWVPTLVVAANILSRRINPAEVSSSILFGDAAGAVVLIPSADEETGVISAEFQTDGSAYDLISIAGGGSAMPFSKVRSLHDLQMTIRDGREVFSRAVDMMTECSRRALEKAGMSTGQIGRFVPHQANQRILDAVGSRLGLDAEKTVSTISEFGNSSAATIPLSLSIAHKTRPFAQGEKVLLAAAGAGMTGGAMVVGF